MLPTSLPIDVSNFSSLRLSGWRMDYGHLQFGKSSPIVVKKLRKDIVDFLYGSTTVARLGSGRG